MTGGGLVARTRRLDHDVDLLDATGGPGDAGVVFERGREGLAGRGVALTVTVGSLAEAVEAVPGALAGIEAEDQVRVPGCGPVAFAAIPFAADEPATFVVPATVTGRAADGTRWVTTVGPADEPGSGPAPGLVPPEAGTERRPRAYRVEAEGDPDEWCDLVARATKRIAAGDLEKVVLARSLRLEADAPIPRRRLLAHLRRTFPGCYVFGVGPMVGASPELLVARAGDVVRAHPMAGTAARGGDPTSDARLAASLLASAKDRAEHQITIDMVWESLLPFCSYVDSEPEPSVVSVANLQHLASMVEGRLSSPPASVLELVRALHPTPAVAGWPVAPAMAFLRAHEQLDRGTYAGAVGWVDAAGNGQWAVGIRSAIVEGSTARLFAGVGVVADSDPQRELEETDVKFQAMLAALVRP